MLVAAVAVVFSTSVWVASAQAAAPGAKPLKKRYYETCAVCHASGTQGAPVSGDAGQWQLRMAKGLDELLANVKQGYKSMPPMGICFDCSDEEFIALIEYMAAPES